MRDALRRQHYSLRTEQSYVDWIKRFILFHGSRSRVDGRFGVRRRHALRLDVLLDLVLADVTFSLQCGVAPPIGAGSAI